MKKISSYGFFSDCGLIFRGRDPVLICGKGSYFPSAKKALLESRLFRWESCMRGRSADTFLSLEESNSLMRREDSLPIECGSFFIKVIEWYYCQINLQNDDGLNWLKFSISQARKKYQYAQISHSCSCSLTVLKKMAVFIGGIASWQTYCLQKTAKSKKMKDQLFLFQGLFLMNQVSVFLLVLVFLLSPAQAKDVQNLFWWGNIDGTNFLTLQRNENSPRYCAASWAFSATSALSDRIKIQRKAQFPDVIISPQVLISCSDNVNGCKGGSASQAYQWISKHNITDITCSPYQGLDAQGGLGCSGKLKCIDCLWDRFVPQKEKCTTPPRPKIYGIKSFTNFKGESDMIKHILEGPITCLLDLTQSFNDYKTGILEDKGEKGTRTHFVSITGWGVEGQKKYWRARNSWGSFWGEGGDFRIVRGVNALNIQSNCSSAIPLDTWTNDIRNNTKLGIRTLKESPSLRSKCKRYSTRLIPQDVRSPRPHEYFNPKDIPQSWDWRNVSGVNYMSWTKNQRAPHYCGACWIEASTSVLADRINIVRNRTWPDISISPQVIINCKYGGSGCDGGNPGHIYMYAKEVGIPEESCQSYTAKNPKEFLCSNEQICHNCNKDGCSPQKRYTVWKVKEHGLVEGAERMKAEIFARGPITCGIDATNKWQDYESGIYSESKLILDENHEISVLGWGKQNGIEYWIGRNSYGSHWGQHGYFRIRMHRNNLGIQLQCSWATVDKEPHIIELDDSQVQSS